MIVGILHAALAPVMVVGGLKPNLALVAVVLVTTLVGFKPGITWAFVAGLTANLLVGDPLGSVPLTMLLVVALVGGGAHLLGRMVWIYPVLATFVGSAVLDVLSILVRQLVSDASASTMPFDIILGAATLNALIAAVVLYPVRALTARYLPDESPAW